MVLLILSTSSSMIATCSLKTATSLLLRESLLALIELFRYPAAMPIIPRGFLISCATPAAIPPNEAIFSK